MMKQIRIRQLCLLVLLMLIPVIFVFILGSNQVSSPAFSHESVVFHEDFWLEITSEPGTSIYYTTDGSVPDRNSLLYTEPILITDVSESENRYSMNTDTTVGFYLDLLEEYSPSKPAHGYQAPDYPVDKCNVIRAVAINSLGFSSDVITATYIHGDSAAQYEDCMILSIVTDPENLFSDDRGIYVTGSTFRDYLERGSIGSSWYHWSANYTRSGSDWEREAVFHLFDKTGKLMLSKDGGIRIQGSSSRSFLPKGLNLFARENYDNTTSFGIQPFGNDYTPQSMVLSSGGNQRITRFNDVFMSDMVSELNTTIVSYTPCVMYLDGEYWGFYWLGERIDEAYLSYYYGIDDAIVIKGNELEIGYRDDLNIFNNMLGYISGNDMTDPEKYAQVCRLVDMDSYIDYYATMIYIARSGDWPGSNTAMWRSRQEGGEGYADGKWRWILYDCNSSSMAASLTEHDTLNYVRSMDSEFDSLWQNEEFRQRFRQRLDYIASECFAPEKVSAYIDSYIETMIPLLTPTWDRFYGSDNTNLEDFLSTMEGCRSFFLGRKAVVDSWFVSE